MSKLPIAISLFVKLFPSLSTGLVTICFFVSIFIYYYLKHKIFEPIMNERQAVHPPALPAPEPENLAPAHDEIVEAVVATPEPTLQNEENNPPPEPAIFCDPVSFRTRSRCW